MISKIDLSFFTVYPGQNLNKDIMAISNFESRKLALKEKRRFVENDKSLTKFERKNEIKKLERQLTLGVPFDSIIVASDGDKLTEILSHLAFYDINANNTFIYGTSLWEDTNKKDKVFENTYFVSNLKSKNPLLKNYKDVFSRDPSSVSFHLFDLIDLVNVLNSMILILRIRFFLENIQTVFLNLVMSKEKLLSSKIELESQKMFLVVS